MSTISAITSSSSQSYMPAPANVPADVRQVPTEKMPATETALNVDTVSISATVKKTPQSSSSSAAVDRVAENMSADINGLMGHVTLLNDAKMFLAEGSRPYGISDEAYKDYLNHMTKNIENLTSTVKSASSALAEIYSITGTMPSEQPSGNWSQGSFTLSTTGKGFTVRGESNENLAISLNGGPFNKWSHDPKSASSTGNSNAILALQTLSDMKKVNYKI